MGLLILDIVDPKVLADRLFHLCTLNYLRGDHRCHGTSKSPMLCLRAKTWDGRNDAGQQVASGVYVYRLKAGPQSLQRQLVHLK